MPDNEWRGRLVELLAGDEWIADGNFRSTLDYRLSRADSVVFLDFPRWRCFWGVTHRVVTRKPQADGCVSKWDAEFARWVWHYNKRTRPQMLAAIDASGVEAVVLRSRAEVRRWLASL
jgi:adenylate kinase family enzyme